MQPPVSGPELAAMMKIGARVVRGVDWKWGDQVLRPLRRRRPCPQPCACSPPTCVPSAGGG